MCFIERHGVIAVPCKKCYVQNSPLKPQLSSTKLIGLVCPSPFVSVGLSSVDLSGLMLDIIL